MPMNQQEPPQHATPLEGLEQMLIAEFLRERGYDASRLAQLTESERYALMSDASVYASTKLTEIETRSHFVHEIHGDAGL